MSSHIDALNRLRSHIEYVPLRLNTLPEIELTRQAPDKWSRKEILGHLIDSAINNLKRFTDAQFADGQYQVQGYNQNKLVYVNQYQNLPLNHLLVLWQGLNRQILYVADNMSTDTLARSIQLGQVITDTKTLGWLIEDYVAHLEHHLTILL